MCDEVASRRSLRVLYPVQPNISYAVAPQTPPFRARKTCSGEDDMDLLYVGLIVGFVAVSCGLTYYFERLRRSQ